MIMKKQALRRQMRERRDSISPVLRHEYDAVITDRIRSCIWYERTSVIYGYMSFRSEVSCRKIMETALHDGKVVAVPKVTGPEMEFYRISSHSEWKPGAYGIMEPATVELVTQPGLMLLPGLAFDLMGNRLGYGGGYYDRYLAHHPMCYKLALGYETQITDRVPASEQDCKVDGIVTEKKLRMILIETGDSDGEAYA